MKTALITGANRGIGIEFCKQLKLKNYNVIGTCRSSNSELDKLDIRVESGVDVTDEASLSKLAERLNGISIDLMINNAGIMSKESIDDLDINSIRKQFEVNTFGPLFMIKTLSNLFANPAKLVLISSRMGSLSDNTSGSYYGYRMSKAALNMAGVSLTCDLKERGVAVAILHPGFVKTDLTGQMGDITADESVKNMLSRVDELSIENSGTFWHANGETLGW